MVSLQEQIDILKSIFGSFYHTGNEYLFYCKSCSHHKKKLSINIDKNKYKCWICGIHGKDVSQLVKKYGNQEQYQRWLKLSPFSKINELSSDDLKTLISGSCEKLSKKEEVKSDKLKLPEEFVSLVGNNSITSRPARNYLKKRGIGEEEINRYKIGYAIENEFQNRIIFPSFDKDGHLNYYVGREYMEEDKVKYKNPNVSKNLIFNELYLDFSKPVTIVEGVFDSVKAGENACPLLGSSFDQEKALFQEIIKNKTDVFIALDPDAAEKENKIIESLLEYRINVYKVDLSGYKDAGEMSFNEFQERKKNAKLVTRSNMMLDKLNRSIA